MTLEQPAQDPYGVSAAGTGLAARRQSYLDLAVAGATPLFKDPLHVGRPNIGNREVLMARIGEVLDRRWLTNNGPVVQELEATVARYLGVRHIVLTCSGTKALEIAARSLGLRGEVVVPSFSFVATAHALQWLDITPVFCDIEAGSHNIDPSAVERLITPRTSGIIGVHVWGRPCDHEGLSRVAHDHGLALLYDASHAFGCSRNGVMVGNLGRVEVFSFHATKILNCFEGGAIATNDDELAAKIRPMRNFGFAGYDNVICMGTNGKMNEISAAMGLTSFESLPEFIAVNRRNYDLYRDGLAGIPGLSLLSWNRGDRTNYQYIVLDIQPETAALNRDELLAILHTENVLARRYFYPGCHRMEPYRSYFPNAGLVLPRTEALVGRVLVLPNGTALSPTDVQGVTAIIRAAMRHGPECRALLQRMTGA
jgi:dTDP-4-amino-4,6-dideoxygalactose transaminase